jgi:hypothetical protein
VSQLAIETPAREAYGIWFDIGPSAGGNAPLWQVEHWFATTVCVWFHLVGFQAEVLWQLTQLTVVGTCVPSFPVAALPLWQLAQLVALVKLLWSGLDAAQDAVDL